MKRGIALMTMTAFLGISAPFVYADTTAPTTMANTTTVASTSIIWIVKSGDSLWKISQSTGVPVTLIAHYNGITNTAMINVGQGLKIPSIWTVKSGDSLWKIAQATGASVQSIAQANGITNEDQIQTGSTLIIPSAAATYTVQSGDVLWKIAMATGVSPQVLIQANNLSNPDSLTVGQTLKIPITTTGNSTATDTSSVGSVVLTSSSADINNSAATQVNIAVPVTVRVKDKQGNTITVPQSQITYTITGTNEVSNPANTKIDSSTQEFTATQPGSYSCVATVDGEQSLPLDIDVIGLPSRLLVNMNHNLVTGSETFVPVSIDVTDSIGQPIMGTPLTVTIDNAKIAGLSLTNTGPITQLPSTITTTTGGGERTIYVQAGTVSGQANIEVTCDGLTQNVPIYSISGPTKITVSVANPTVIANTNFRDLVTVQAYNADGSPAAGVPLSADYSLGLFNSLNNTVTTNSQGVGQFVVYENNTSTGIGEVGARTSHAAADTPITIVPGVNAAQSTASLPSTLTLGQSYVVPITVKDASGNPILNLDQAAFDLHLQGTDGVYDVQGNVSELGNGQYKVTFFNPGSSDYENVNSMRNGNYLASIMVNGEQVGSSQFVNVTTASYPAKVQPDNAPNIALTFPQKLIANSYYSSMYPLQIKLTNANGNPVANQEVSLSSNNTNVAIPTNAVVTTNANGLAETGITPGFMPGTATITAVSGTTAQTITAQSVAEPASITLSAPTSTVASNGGSVTVTAKVLNTDGSPASGIALEIFSVTSNESSSMAPINILTDANGMATFQVTPSDFSSGNTLNVQVDDNHFLKSNTLTFTLN